jgi:hypothetical protein
MNWEECILCDSVPGRVPEPVKILDLNGQFQAKIISGPAKVRSRLVISSNIALGKIQYHCKLNDAVDPV